MSYFHNSNLNDESVFIFWSKDCISVNLKHYIVFVNNNILFLQLSILQDETPHKTTHAIQDLDQEAGI
jgi:hypothetical protein